jgi:glycosyltransferase 2 family protein
MLERQRQNNQGSERPTASAVRGWERREGSSISEAGHAMLQAIRRTILVLRQKQILHRLGVAVSVTVIGIACYVLYHMLRGIDVDEVIEAIKSTESSDIALAGLFVAAGYFTLTFYDLFAVRAIGHSRVPYRINALAAFTSYSIGHNVGASVFTGGAVRYRIYSAWGLNAIDVAKICFIAGLTFWLGNAAVLGLGISYHPEAASAIDQLPPWLNRIVAVGIILGLVAYVAWVWSQPRAVGRGPWTVLLPGGPLTLLQIAIGIVDLAFCALAMYVLVPDEPNLGFVVVAVIFVSATLLGFASHSPGGLGVFDAAMLVGLWQMDREELLAGMLLFRLLYYIVPFVISVILLTFREVIIGTRSKRLRQAALALEAEPAREAAYVRERRDPSA